MWGRQGDPPILKIELALLSPRVKRHPLFGCFPIRQNSKFRIMRKGHRIIFKTKVKTVFWDRL